MKIHQLLIENRDNSDLIQILTDFLPLAMKEIGITHLPKIKLVSEVPDSTQPTFGKYEDHKKMIWLAIRQRHPLDILRTLAHELVHFKQGINHELAAGSGETGSPEENEAHEVAGIVMRHFNKEHPQYFNVDAVGLDESAAWQKSSGKNKNGGLNKKGVQTLGC